MLSKEGQGLMKPVGGLPRWWSLEALGFSAGRVVIEIVDILSSAEKRSLVSVGHSGSWKSETGTALEDVHHEMVSLMYHIMPIRTGQYHADETGGVSRTDAVGQPRS